MDDPKAIAEAAERRAKHIEAVGKNGRPQSSPYFQQLSGQPWWSENLSNDAVILADAHLASERSAAEAMRERAAQVCRDLADKAKAESRTLYDPEKVHDCLMARISFLCAEKAIDAIPLEETP